MIPPSVVIILIEPENPDNVGAVARAMKNMGLSELRLVKPAKRWKVKGKKMAMTACDVLEKAISFNSVQKAVEDIHLVIGTTRRGGPRRGSFMPFKEVVKKIKKVRRSHHVAIMFGRESKGLDNQSLSFCDWVTTIPADPAYPSLNLAQAVMVVAFSLFDHGVILPPAPPRRGKFKEGKTLPKCREAPAYLSKEDVLRTLDRFDEALEALGYGEKRNKVMPRIRATLYRLFKRNGFLESEAQMFKGISRRICEMVSFEGAETSNRA